VLPQRNLTLLQKTNCVINAIASLHAPGANAQEAVDTIVKALAETVNKLDRELQDVRPDYTEDEYAMLIRYADACKQMVIGALHFSLRSSRYAVSVGKEDNSLEIPL
jgi:hypothetical protein